MKSILKMSIKKRLIWGFATIMVVLFSVQTITLVNTTYGILDFNDNYNTYSEAVRDAGMAYAHFHKGMEEAYKVRYVDESEIKSIGENARGYLDIALTELKEVEEVIKDDEEISELYTYAYGAISNLHVATETLVEKISNGYTISDAQLEEVFTSIDRIDDAMDGILLKIEEKGAANNTATLNGMQTTLSVAAVLAVVLMVYIIIVLVISIRSIQYTLNSLKEAAKELADGDVSVEIKSISKDEIGEVTDIIGDVLSVMKGQAEFATEMAEGNFDIEVVPKSDVDALGNALKVLVDKNNETLSSIKEATYQVTTGAEEVSSASQSLAQGSTEQASAIQQITATIADITERTKVNASDANNASELVNKAKDEAVLGSTRMNEMIDAMGEINDSSENISKIIKVIDDIAFQTNILALNAAVEAARAGAHGKGFAVVAEEVRNLAGKSAQAASETAEMIEDSIRKVEKGSKLAKDTAASLDTIAETIDTIVKLVDSIALASNDQATAITQIDQAILQVSQVVQTNSATSEECAAASQQLAVQAEKLRDMIARYKLKNPGMSQNMNQNYNQGYYNNTYDGNMYGNPYGNIPYGNNAYGNADTGYVPQGAAPVISLTDNAGKY